jgi:flavorubredoxin
MTLTPQPFLAQRVTDNVYWVGAIDWTLQDFHGYRTERGSTYNAFLVLADKVTLIDTVKKAFLPEMMARIASVIDPAKIEYVVSNHAEMDHSGSLPEVIAQLKPQKIFASANGVKALQQHFHLATPVTAVENGGKIDLGNMTLACVETRMIHWPDSMISFLDRDGLLFAQDAFGMHLATSQLFADQHPRHILLWELEKYYANIVLPYSGIVAKALAALRALNLPIRIIAPDHGPLYRTPEDIHWVLEQYDRMVAQRPTKKAVVVFDSMWQSTELMARVVAEGLTAAGATVKVMSMHSAERSNVITELLNAGALVVGSCTMNNEMFPTMADVLTYVRGLKPANLIGAIFGSYGWSQNAFKAMQDYMTGMKIELVAEPLKVNYVPTRENLLQCFALGQQVGTELLQRCGG